MRRARLLAVLTILAAGALGIISSTQTWLTVTLDDGAHHELTVAGAAAIPVLAALSLAVLALGAALSIVGVVLRYVFAALTIVIAGALGALTAQVAFAPPITAVAGTVTTATGISGADAVDELVLAVAASAWPFVTLAGWIVLLAAGIFTVITARRWPGSGRKYGSDAAPRAASRPGSRPADAIDSWDDLSRGEDPTAGPVP